MDSEKREKATSSVLNRQQRRKMMRNFGLLDGATRKRTASLKVVR